MFIIMDGLGICLLILVVVSFMLFLIRVVFIFYHNILIARELKRLSREVNARQCAAVTGIELSNQTGNQPPKDDLPPAYDDVMQAYINAKLDLQTAEEGQVAGTTISSPETNLTNAHSTVTIETSIDTNSGSSNDLRNTSTETITQTNNTSSDITVLPPTYERCMSDIEVVTNGTNGNNKSSI